MNYMKQVAEMLGVELGERFRLIDDDYEMESEFYFTENGLYSDAKRRPVCEDDILPGILDGTFEIARKPWKPKNGDTFWRVCFNFRGGEYICRSEPFSSDGAVDVALLAFGNCFRTREEAEAHKDEIIAKMREVLEG